MSAIRMHDTNPLLSVFIPVYNGERYIEETIKSILGSTYSDFEVLLLDDGSTDNSVALMRQLAIHDDRLKVFAMPNVGTVPRNWNRIKNFIHGKYVLYLSQDDLVERDLFDNFRMRQLETNADIIIPELKEFFTDEFDASNVVIRQQGFCGDYSVVLTGEAALRNKFLGKIPNGFAFYRSEIRKSYFFDEDIYNSDDLSAFEHLTQASTVAFCRGAVIYRQSNPNAITKKPSVFKYSGMFTEDKLLQLRKQYLPETFEATLRNSVEQMAWSYYRYLTMRKNFSVSDNVLIVNYFHRSCLNKAEHIKHVGILKYLLSHPTTLFLLVHLFSMTGVPKLVRWAHHFKEWRAK